MIGSLGAFNSVTWYSFTFGNGESFYKALIHTHVSDLAESL